MTGKVGAQHAFLPCVAVKLSSVLTSNRRSGLVLNLVISLKPRSCWPRVSAAVLAMCAHRFGVRDPRKPSQTKPRVS